MSYLSVFAILPYKSHILEANWRVGKRQASGIGIPTEGGPLFSSPALRGAGGKYLTKGIGMSQMKYKQIKPGLDLKEPTM